jgi:hypothetical protein
MALGVVPIVVGYGGPAELVSATTGFALAMNPRATVVRELRGVLADAVAAPSSIQSIGRRARDRVFRHFTWDTKAAQVVEVYRWVLGRRDKPDFGMPLPDLDDRRSNLPSASRSASSASQSLIAVGSQLP